MGSLRACALHRVGVPIGKGRPAIPTTRPYKQPRKLSMEIIPNKGIGTVEFGMTPREVMSIMGEELVYEDWMGGNLNGSLYYPGIVFWFDQWDGYGSLEIGSLIEIWIHDSFHATYKELPLFPLKQDAVEELLQSEGVPYTIRGGGASAGIYIEAYHLEFAFRNTNLIQISLFVPR